MSRQKGKPKTGGRQKETPNKLSGAVRDFLAKLIDKNRIQMEEDLKNLPPKERLMMLEKFMQYVIPKQKEVELNGELVAKPTSQQVEDMQLLDSLPDDVIADIAEQLQLSLARYKEEIKNEA